MSRPGPGGNGDGLIPGCETWEPVSGWELCPKCQGYGCPFCGHGYIRTLIVCPRCEGQRYDVGSCGLCGNVGWLDENGERVPVCEVVGDRQAKDSGDGQSPSCAGDS